MFLFLNPLASIILLGFLQSTHPIMYEDRQPTRVESKKFFTVTSTLRNGSSAAATSLTTTNCSTRFVVTAKTIVRRFIDLERNVNKVNREGLRTEQKFKNKNPWNVWPHQKRKLSGDAFARKYLENVKTFSPTSNQTSLPTAVNIFVTSTSSTPIIGEKALVNSFQRCNFSNRVNTDFPPPTQSLIGMSDVQTTHNGCRHFYFSRVRQPEGSSITHHSIPSIKPSGLEFINQSSTTSSLFHYHRIHSHGQHKYNAQHRIISSYTSKSTIFPQSTQTLFTHIHRPTESLDAKIHKRLGIWQLYNHCSGGFLESFMSIANAKGRPENGCLINFIVHSFRIDGSILLEQAQSGRFICFSRRKRVVVRKSHNNYDAKCRFREHLTLSGYTLLESAYVEGLYMGFNRLGHFQNSMRFDDHRFRRCFHYSKLEFDGRDEKKSSHNCRIHRSSSKNSGNTSSSLRQHVVEKMMRDVAKDSFLSRVEM